MTPLLRKANDDKAFERLYRRHVKDVFRYSLAVLGERADAEDVTQTTFLNAYRAFQRGERPDKPENWLIAIAHNVCRQRFRQQQRRPSEVEFEDELGGAVAGDEDGPSVDELRRAFAALQPNQRAALVMRELEGRSYGEIAAVLGITVSALETLLFRARRALREQLEEQLSCRETALAISKQMDGRLSAGERRALRAHLRGCPECARLASSQRAQRKTLRTLLAVPLPQSLQTFLPHASEAAAAGSAAAAGGTAIAVKAAAVVAAGTLVGGGAYEGVKYVPPLVTRHAATAPRAAAVRRPAAARAAAPAAAAVPKPDSAAAVQPARKSARPGVVSRPQPSEQAAAVGKPTATEGATAAPGHRPKSLVPAKPGRVQPGEKAAKAHRAEKPAPAGAKPHESKSRAERARTPPAAHGKGKKKRSRSDPAAVEPQPTTTAPDLPLPLSDPLPKPEHGRGARSLPPVTAGGG